MNETTVKTIDQRGIRYRLAWYGTLFQEEWIPRNNYCKFLIFVGLGLVVCSVIIAVITFVALCLLDLGLSSWLWHVHPNMMGEFVISELTYGTAVISLFILLCFLAAWIGLYLVLPFIGGVFRCISCLIVIIYYGIGDGISITAKYTIHHPKLQQHPTWCSIKSSLRKLHERVCPKMQIVSSITKK